MKLVSIARRENVNCDPSRHITIYCTEGYGYRVHIEGAGEYSRPDGLESAFKTAQKLCALSSDEIEIAEDQCRKNESQLYEPRSHAVVTVSYTDKEWRLIKYVSVGAGSIERLDNMGEMRLQMVSNGWTGRDQVVRIPYAEMNSELQIEASYGPGITYRRANRLQR